MDEIRNRHHATLATSMRDPNQHQSRSGQPDRLGEGVPRIWDVVAAAVEHSTLFAHLLTLQDKARTEREGIDDLDRASPGAEAVREALHSAYEVSSLAVRLLAPSQRESSYRAFSDLFSALDKIHDLRVSIAEGHRSLPVNPDQLALVRRCSAIESEVIASVQAYTRAVIPQLLTKFFDSVEPLEPEQVMQYDHYSSAQKREAIKTAVGHDVLSHPSLQELPPLPTLERFVIQGIVSFELLSSLTDQLLAAPRPTDTGVMRDVLEEFMGVICEARGCHERSYEQILAGLSEPDQQRFKQMVAPLDELLHSGHRRFVEVFKQAQ